MQRLKIGVIGAGGVAQVEHIPNLARLEDHFELVGVVDPSPTSRGFVSDRFGVSVHPDIDGLLGMTLDAVVVASPDALHFSHVSTALKAGLHVFCEKPLCYAPSDILELAERRNAAGKVLQTGYMKRFDPSYESLLALLPSQAGALRQVAVEVYDPDAAPFIRHHDWRLAQDLPAESGASLRALQAEQVARAIGTPLDAIGYKGFCAAYASAIVHDVNAVHGMFDVLGTKVGQVTGAAFYASGLGGQGAVSLNGGEAIWTMSHLTTTELPHYSERITLVFEGSSLELEFPSPWLNHAPTRLTERRGSGHSLDTRHIHTGYEEAFVEELKGFHRAVTTGEKTRNPAEDAARDMDLLVGLTRFATKGTAA